jgi:hypothetical protein
MMHFKKGEDKKKAIINPSCFSFFFFCGQAKLLCSPSSTNEYVYKPTESPSTKKKKKEHITMESL